MRYKDLLNANAVLELLTKKLNLDPKPMGKSVFFFCPFHEEKSPSLSFEPNQKFFKCFGCDFKSGSIFDF
jgi:DNA primase